MVEEEGVMGAAHGLVQVSVGADDAGAFASQLQRHGDDVLCRLPHDNPAHLRAACKCHLHTHSWKSVNSTIFSGSHISTDKMFPSLV